MALLERVAEPGEDLRKREAEQQAVKREDELENANWNPSRFAPYVNLDSRAALSTPLLGPAIG